MKLYKRSDFILRDTIEPDITHWESEDGLLSITTSIHPGADYYVMRKDEEGNWIQTGIKELTFKNAINAINNSK